MINGKVVREYVNLDGKVLANRGEISPDEKRLGIVFNDAKFPDEQDVANLAGSWSIDPTTLDELKLGKSVGYLGSSEKN